MPGARGGGRTFVNPNFSHSLGASDAITIPGRQTATSNDARSGDNSQWPSAGGRPPRRQRDNRQQANNHNENAESALDAAAALPSNSTRGRRGGGGARNRRGGGRVRQWSPSMEYGTSRAQTNQSTDVRGATSNTPAYSDQAPSQDRGPWSQRNSEFGRPALSTRTTATAAAAPAAPARTRTYVAYNPQRFVAGRTGSPMLWEPRISDEWGDDVEQANQAQPSGYATARSRASAATGRRNGGARATPHPWASTEDEDEWRPASITPDLQLDLSERSLAQVRPLLNTSSRGARGGGRHSNNRERRAVASATTRNSQGNNDDHTGNDWRPPASGGSRPSRGGRRGNGGERERAVTAPSNNFNTWRQPAASPDPSSSPPQYDHWSTNASDGYDRDHVYSPADLNWSADLHWDEGERDVADWWSPHVEPLPRLARQQPLADTGSGFLDLRTRPYVQQPQPAARSRNRRNRRRTRAAAAQQVQQQLLGAHWAPPDYVDWGLADHHDSLENIPVWAVHGDQWDRDSANGDEIDWMDLIEHVQFHHMRERTTTEDDEAKQERLKKIREVDNQKDTLAMRYSRACGICITPNPRVRFALKECGHILCAYCVEQVERFGRERVYCPYCRSVTGYVRIWETVEEEGAEATAATAASAEVSQQ